MFRRFCALAVLLLPFAARADDVAQVRYLEHNGRVTITTKGPATAQTQFTLASVGKTMTAVAVLRLAEAGIVSLDDPVADWVAPDITQGLGGLRGVTLRHLLTMTSGLPDDLTDAYVDAALAGPDTVQPAAFALRFAFDEAESLLGPDPSHRAQP